MVFEQNDCFGELGLSLKLCVPNKCKICRKTISLCGWNGATKTTAAASAAEAAQCVTNNQYSDFGNEATIESYVSMCLERATIFSGFTAFCSLFMIMIEQSDKCSDPNTTQQQHM